MSSVKDSAGCTRLPRADHKLLDPCKCSKSTKGQYCDKNYCPCRKRGYYCGSECDCRKCNGDCCNSSGADLPIDQPEAKVQSPTKKRKSDVVEEDDEDFKALMKSLDDDLPADWLSRV